MSETGSLLHTKLFIPPLRPFNVPRPHLVEKLNDRLWLDGRFLRPLTLISAPAGFGKTSVVAEWLYNDRLVGIPIAWLSLDEADNDPARFAAYWLAAMQQVAPALGAGLLSNLPTPLPTLQPLVTQVLNQLATLPQYLLLVLDDFHLIENEQVQTAVSLFTEHLPPNAHLVLTSREDPPLPLSQIVAAFNIDSDAIAPRGTPLAIVGRGMTGLDEQIAAVAKRERRRLVDSDAANAYVRRQDGWALLQHDIPAVLVSSAYGDIRRMEAFFESDYHRPSDDLKHKIQLGGAAEDVAFHVALARWFADVRRVPPPGG